MEENYKAITTALGIYDLGNKYPSELSGGQQQRTAAARAFVHKPQIIFADEPTGALDSKSANDLLQRLEEMNKSFDTTIVMVTHDPVAASFAERVIMLKDGQIHTQLYQEGRSKQAFYEDIVHLQSVLGGVYQMTFNHIVFKNLRQNLKHYAMYLFSLFFSIVLYFSFTTLQFTKGVNNDDSMAIIKKGALVGSIFLFIIIVIFLMYANHLFVKRRTREFALFQLIGLTRQNILKMLALEQMMSIFNHRCCRCIMWHCRCTIIAFHSI